MGRQVREEFAHLEAALPVLFELERRGQQSRCRALGAEVDLLGPLAGELVDGRLRVQEVRAERASVHEQMNDPLRLRLEVRAARGRGCDRCEEGREAERAHPATELLEHLAARGQDCGISEHGAFLGLILVGRVEALRDPPSGSISSWRVSQSLDPPYACFSR